MTVIETWYPIAGTLKRRGRPDKYAGFYEFTPGVVEPLGTTDAGGPNVGPRYPLSIYNGDITLTTPGQVLEGLDIYGKVYISGTATNAIIRDCIIRGPNHSLTTNSIIGGQSDNLRNVTIEWCRLDGTGRTSPWTEGVRGGNYTIRYSEIMRCVDGISAVNYGNGTIECCRIHNGSYYAWKNDSSGTAWTNYAGYDGVTYTTFPGQSDFTTHSDAMQIHQFSNWVLRGCSLGGTVSGLSPTTKTNNRDPSIPAQRAIIDQIDAAEEFNNACIMIGVATAGVGAMIEKNWFQGGAAVINMQTKPSVGDYLAGITVRDNKFRTSTGYYIYHSTDFAGTLSNNTFVSNGQPVPIDTY